MNSKMIRNPKKTNAIIRDIWSYDSRCPSKGSFLTESVNVTHSLSKDFTIEEVRKQALDGIILRQRTNISSEYSGAPYA